MNYSLKYIIGLGSKSLMIASALVLFACDASKMDKIPIERFEGEWHLQGRSTVEGLQVEISTFEDGFEGHVTKLNTNKYIQFFLEEGDQWVMDISRISNFEFSLTELKIGNELFSMYDLDTKQKFKVQFIDEDTFGLSKGSADPKTSKMIYKRVE